MGLQSQYDLEMAEARLGERLSRVVAHSEDSHRPRRQNLNCMGTN